METREIDYKFRGHHAPTQGLDLLLRTRDLDKENVIEEFSKSNNWANSECSVQIKEILQTNFRTRKQKEFLKINNQQDEYSEDLLGSNPLSRLSQLERMVDIEIEDIDNLSFGDIKQTVIVGSMLDR